MSREIKFRAWHKLGNKFIEKPTIIFSPEDGGFAGCQTSIHGDNYGAGPFSSNQFYTKDNIIIQQYTGLKDKNEKEIYEGDILKICFRDEDSCMDATIEEIAQVYFHPNLCVMGLKSNIYYKEFTSLLHITEKYVPLETIEIIGNIFENPELINK